MGQEQHEDGTGKEVINYLNAQLRVKPVKHLHMIWQSRMWRYQTPIQAPSASQGSGGWGRGNSMCYDQTLRIFFAREPNKWLYFPGKKNPDDEDTERKDKKGNERQDTKGVKYGFCFFLKKIKWNIVFTWKGCPSMPGHLQEPRWEMMERKKSKLSVHFSKIRVYLLSIHFKSQGPTKIGQWRTNQTTWGKMMKMWLENQGKKEKKRYEQWNT